MGYLILSDLLADLPENWTDNQFVSPGGVEVGLTPKHGYNYLMRQVNLSQYACRALDSGMHDLMYHTGYHVLTSDSTGHASLSHLIRGLHEEDVMHMVAKVKDFQDLPSSNTAYLIIAYNNESYAWDVQAIEVGTNRIFVRSLNVNSGWLTSKWDEIMHTGSYERLTGLVPAYLE